MKYLVGITIYQTIEVDAENKEAAEEAVRDMSDKEILNDSDFNITYIDEQE